MAKPPTLLWLRRDLRLDDHAAMRAALSDGGPVIPVFILEPTILGRGGAAPAWRLSKSLKSFARSLEGVGAKLIIRRGDALATLRALVGETGAQTVRWSRLYDADSIERDTAVKAALREDGLDVESHEGWLLREPFELKTQTGGPYKVYSPFWRAFRQLDDPAEPIAAPGSWPAPDAWPQSLTVDDLGLEGGMRRGGNVVATFARVGEAAALSRMDSFLEERIGAYGGDRDRLDRDGTSGLSAHLALGEISPRRIWTAAQRAILGAPGSESGGETFLKELVWREFAWHLFFHSPDMADKNWRSEWDAFPWSEDADAEPVLRWKQGRTGVDVIDAAMRELYVTGRMHNRARMLVASYLTKTLMTHWRVGEAWFRDTLVDWDPASNAMGWQWSAGSGPDASPFFRIFNPETQAEKFDPEGVYRRRWLADFDGDLVAQDEPSAEALAFFEACPKRWGLSPKDARPAPVISLKAGRQRALDAYEALRNS